MYTCNFHNVWYSLRLALNYDLAQALHEREQWTSSKHSVRGQFVQMGWRLVGFNS